MGIHLGSESRRPERAGIPLYIMFFLCVFGGFFLFVFGKEYQNKYWIGHTCIEQNMLPSMWPSRLKNCNILDQTTPLEQSDLGLVFLSPDSGELICNFHCCLSFNSYRKEFAPEGANCFL